MSDELEVVRRVIQEHHTVRDSIKLVGDQLTDLEVFIALRATDSEWVPEKLDNFPEKLKGLQRKMSALQEGLINHSNFEEESLWPILGDLFTEAVLIEHRELGKEVTRVKSMVDDSNFAGLSWQELVQKQWQIRDALRDVLAQAEGHAAREDAILYMVERALEARAKQPQQVPT